MRIVFMGTPEFAVASLEVLVKNNFNVVGVITAPDKPSGRGQQMSQSAVKRYAVAHGLFLMQPTNLKSDDFLTALKALNADLQIVVAFRMLPERVWDMPPEGTYNLHASLLPKYRGAAPINWAIINGDRESGVTTFRLKHDIDTGNILLQEKLDIAETMTAGELHDLLMDRGADLVLRTAQLISDKMQGGAALRFLEQNESHASHAPKIFRETCRIDWQKPAHEIYNLVRGLSPYPSAFSQLKNGNNILQTVKIFSAEKVSEEHSNPIGTVLSDQRTFLSVFCADGYILVKELQLEGKRKMKVEEFLRGFKINDGAMMIF